MIPGRDRPEQNGSGAPGPGKSGPARAGTDAEPAAPTGPPEPTSPGRPGDAAEPAARAERAAVWRQALSIGVATGTYGISFGALGVTSGLSLLQTCLLSLLMFTGGSQFAFAGVVGAGGSGAAAVATAGLLGARNGFYGLQMSPLLRPSRRHRPLAAHLTIDESTAVGLAQLAVHPGRLDLARLGFWSTAGSVFVLWNLATLAGGLLGNALGDPRRFGLDAAAAAAFLALLWPRLSSATPRWVALGGATVAVILIPIAPAGVPVLAAALVGITVGLRERARTTPDDGPAPEPEQAAAPGTGSGRARSPGTEPAQAPAPGTGTEGLLGAPTDPAGAGRDDRREAR
ncbi:MAG TPA: AzlC family ABC transporter permease [Kineosporiaceae bacterium]|nr:AzlC family ABC transporter permease [Kineosporiaceae bacterium]